LAGLDSQGSTLPPHQSLQPPPAGAHAPAAWCVAPAVAKVENFCSTRFPPHCGHSGGSWRRVKTIFSKTCPQLGQAYSKIGMANQTHSSRLRSLGARASSSPPMRHGKSSSLLRFEVTAFLIPLRGGPTPRSSKTRDAGDAWQDYEPDHQKENVNQEAMHSQISTRCEIFRRPRPSRKSAQARHSRESGNPIFSGPVWTPADAGVTKKPGKTSLTPQRLFERTVSRSEPNPGIRNPCKSASGAQSFAQDPGSSLPTVRANRPCVGSQKAR